MTFLLILSYLGGVLTIVSPCILPVLPFVFTRADQPFIRSGLPLLIGMVVTFAAIASLAAIGGGWAVQANQYGRWAAIALLAVFGVTLLIPELADRMTRPLVALGSRLSQSANADGHQSARGSIVPSFFLGVATGLLWAPCAGPVLGLILTGAALQGASTGTSLLLLSYAAGAATSLALALLVGGRVFAAMKRSLGAGEWIRRGLGVAVLAAVAAIALGLDTGYLTSVALTSTTSLEQELLNRLRPGSATTEPLQSSRPAIASDMPAASTTTALPIEGTFPTLSGAVQWLNSPALTPQALRGQVVLIDFWTYSCINCLRSIPYVRAWAQKYKDQGLVVIGVHTPEFAFEKDVGNIRRATTDLKIGYPVAVDNNYAIWRAFNNQYWPAHYFIDAQGRVRYHHFGEGDYEHSERVIQQLLAEAGKAQVTTDMVTVKANGIEAPPDMAEINSPETYVGYDRASNFASPGGIVQDVRHVYSADSDLQLNQWALDGDWTVGGEHARLNTPGGRIVFRFHARDLHLVLGPERADSPIRYKVMIDGKPPQGAHGVDIDEQGNGIVTEQRLYQLIRQTSNVTDHTFEIQFLRPDVDAFAFTFG